MKCSELQKRLEEKQLLLKEKTVVTKGGLIFTEEGKIIGTIVQDGTVSDSISITLFKSWPKSQIFDTLESI